MDIESYLLGKKSSSGGGGGGLDWTSLGYNGTPQEIVDGYNYALQIKNNWTDDASLASKFSTDSQLMFFPKVISTNCTSMKLMFTKCYRLMYGDFSQFNTSKVQRMDSMFSECRDLVELDLSSFTSESLTKTSQMFQKCPMLRKIDIRNMSFANVTSFSDMFGSATDGLANDCLIIVKDNTEKSWITSNFTRLTNVKTVAEYESNNK
jgi:hypothetical protein